jgi:transposase
MTLSQLSNLKTILLTIYCFIDDFFKGIVNSIQYALQRPERTRPPTPKRNVGVAELVSLALFRFFTGHHNWKDFYYHIKTYHHRDFPRMPAYQNFIVAMNQLSCVALLLLHGFMTFFKSITSTNDPKFTDSTKLKACEIKREFSNKVAQHIAKKAKSSMGWFYGFKLHIICNELMHILNFRITAGNVDDRTGLEMMWNDIFGMIVADAGYLGKNWHGKAHALGKQLLAGVRANMQKIMTETQHQLLKMRQCVETVFSVLKLRFGIESTLARSELGFFAHYIWSITAYQFKKFVEYLDRTRITGGVALLSGGSLS